MADILTQVLAMWGAVLSTILAIREIQKDKPRVRVSCKFATVSFPTGGSWHGISIDAVNTGNRPVEVQEAGLLLSDGGRLVEPYTNLGPGYINLPKKLDAGESVTAFLDLSPMEKGLEEANQTRRTTLTAAYVRDAEGRIHRGRIPKTLLPEFQRRRHWLPVPFTRPRISDE